ncbi:MAG: hypothetical protein HYU80_01055 [Candidatus Blackburnbacteria bacterium]|nr:hypothetical protein [Candidatus Blackburnbacteria bacterium]
MRFNRQKGFASILILLVVVILAVVVYVAVPKPGGIEYIKKQLTWPRPTPTPTPPPGCSYQEVQCVKAPCDPVLLCTDYLRPTATTDETAGWKTYTNPKYLYEFKYPQTWQLIVDPKTEGREVSIKSPNEELIHAVVFSGEDDSQNNSHRRTFHLKDSGYLLFTYVECDGPGCGSGKLDILTFSKIFSTFKFID